MSTRKTPQVSVTALRTTKLKWPVANQSSHEIHMYSYKNAYKGWELQTAVPAWQKYTKLNLALSARDMHSLQQQSAGSKFSLYS